MNPDTLHTLQNALTATHLEHTHFLSGLIWFIVGLLFVYMEIWMKPEVDERLIGPYLYAKTHARSIAFALVSYIAIYSLWLSMGLNFDFNGENLFSLEKGKINGMICIVAYSSSAIFTAISGKYQKVRNAPPTNGGETGKEELKPQ
jgi:hypothetical protein